MRTSIPNFAKTGLILGDKTKLQYSAIPGAMKRCLNYSLEGDKIIPYSPYSAPDNMYHGDGTPGSYEMTRGATPKQFFPVYYSGLHGFVYLDNDKAWVPDGSNVCQDLTRAAGGNYNVIDHGWDFFQNGNIAIFHPSGDTPQLWSPMTPLTKFVALPGWDVNHTCRKMVFFKNFFIALGLTKSGTEYPSMMKWSSLAPNDTYPTSWDHTDPATLAGELILPGSSTPIIDAIVHDDMLYIFKTTSVVRVRYIGGNSIFYPELLTTSWGLAFRHAVTEVEGQLCVLTSTYDVGFVEGKSIRSIARGRIDKFLASKYIELAPTSSVVKLRYDCIKQKLYLFDYGQVILAWNRTYDLWESYGFEHVVAEAHFSYYTPLSGPDAAQGLVAVFYNSNATPANLDFLMGNLSLADGSSRDVDGQTFYSNYYLEYYSIFPPITDGLNSPVLDVFSRKRVNAIWTLLDFPQRGIEYFGETSGTVYTEDDSILIPYDVQEQYTPPLSILDLLDGGTLLHWANYQYQTSLTEQHQDALHVPLMPSLEGRNFGLFIKRQNDVDVNGGLWAYTGFWFDWELIGGMG